MMKLRINKSKNLKIKLINLKLNFVFRVVFHKDYIFKNFYSKEYYDFDLQGLMIKFSKSSLDYYFFLINLSPGD